MTLQALIAPVIVILLVVVGVILLLVFAGARIQDRAEIGRSQQIAVSALELVGRDLGRLAIGHARSGHAYLNLARKYDPAWAESRLGGDLHYGFGSARAYVFGPNNELLFQGGEEAPQTTGSLGALLSRVRAMPVLPPDADGGFIRIGDTAYVAAASIVATTDREGGGATGTVLVLAQPIDESLLNRLEEDFLLGGLRFEDSNESGERHGLFLDGLDGDTIGVLLWAPQLPGRELIADILIPIVIATLLAGLLLSQFLMTAVRTAQEIKRGAAALMKSGQALEHSEIKLRAIIDGVADAIVAVDASGAITSANESAGRIFGYEQDDMIGRNADMLLAEAAREAGDGDESPRNSILRADTDVTGTQYRELTGRRRDGSRFVLDTAISHITYQSSAIAIAIMRDVTERRQAEETLNLLSTGMILVNSESRLLMANRSASRILESGHGLIVVDGRVAATSKSCAEQLRGLVEDACGTGGGDSKVAASVMIIERGDVVRPLSVMVAPLQLTQSGEGSPVAAIFIRDLEARQTVAPEILTKLFGLTPAEARVAVELVKGKRPQEVADDLSVSLNTVRNQLKQIFSKTSTGRQSELISLVLSSTAFVSEQGVGEDESGDQTTAAGP